MCDYDKTCDMELEYEFTVQREAFASSFQKSPKCHSLKHPLLNLSLLSLSNFLFEECARLEPNLPLFTLSLGWSNRLECVWWGGLRRRPTCPTPPPTLHMCLAGPEKLLEEPRGQTSAQMRCIKGKDLIIFNRSKTSERAPRKIHDSVPRHSKDQRRRTQRSGSKRKREKEKQQKWQDKRNLDFVWESIDFFSTGLPTSTLSVISLEKKKNK